jgi:hypothetical protein
MLPVTRDQDSIVDDHDRLGSAGHDNPITVRGYNPETLEYRVQRGDDHASSQWVPEIYFEPADADAS